MQDLTAVASGLTNRSLILVTGANGFVGSALVARLVHQQIRTRACVRRDGLLVPSGVETVRVTGLSDSEDWSQALIGVSIVVHAAARVHVMVDKTEDPLAEFRRINVQGTLHLARQAAEAGVRRFIFISSIKVNGEETKPGQPFTADDPPAPIDAYGISKLEAERGLQQLASQTRMEVVIIRPPLVYGPKVQANFAALMVATKRGWPLPLAAICNKRSLVGLDNLVDLITVTATHPSAGNQIFLASDGSDLSTPELIRAMAIAMGGRARLLPMPVWALRMGANLMNRKAIIQRLCGNLQVDIGKTKVLLNWTPPIDIQEGLRRAAAL